MLEKLKARIAEINAAIEASLANHNTLLGHRNEAQHILATLTAPIEAAVAAEEVAIPVVEAELVAG